MAEKPQPAITAQAFRLVDGNGVLRASLNCALPGGMPQLEFYGPGEQTRISLQLESTGNAVFSLLGKSGHKAIGFGVNDSGSGVSVWDSAERILLTAGVEASGTAYVMVFDEHGECIWHSDRPPVP